VSCAALAAVSASTDQPWLVTLALAGLAVVALVDLVVVVRRKLRGEPG